MIFMRYPAIHRKENKERTGARRGFSLIELMVSVALFTIVMTISIGTLLALVNANQKAESLKSVINNLNFGLESMARTIRTGHLYYCTTSNIDDPLPTGTQDCSSGEKGLVLTDDKGKRVAYRLQGTVIVRATEDDPEWIPFTAPEVVVDGMLFYVTGTTPAPDDLLQPTVTISIRGHAGVKADTESEFHLETTVTQRLIDQ